MAATTTTTKRPPVTVRRSNLRRRGGRVGLYATALLVGLFSVFPLFWMLLTSVKPRAEIVTREPVFWPSTFELERYANVLARGFTTYLGNSLLVSVTVTVVGVLFAALAGYALARFNLPLKRYLLLLVLATQMFPVVVLLIPYFTVMRQLSLLNTYTGLIVTYMSFSIPLAIWILRGFFRGIPDELEEAAMVDGCTRFGAMWRIILPLAGPGIAACSIYVFIAAWNEFLFALTFTNSDSMRTLPVALQAFIGRDATDHGAIMAASTLFTIPVVVFFLFVHRRLTEGMVSGAVKG
jgi:ABC-type glycerol-3-phosphate transport system permease component